MWPRGNKPRVRASSPIESQPALQEAAARPAASASCRSLGLRCTFRHPCSSRFATHTPSAPLRHPPRHGTRPPAPQVTLIDQGDRFVFKPLLYELLTGAATADEVAPTFSRLLAPYPITFLQGKVAMVQPEHPTEVCGWLLAGAGGRSGTMGPSGKGVEGPHNRKGGARRQAGSQGVAVLPQMLPHSSPCAS